MQADWDVEVGGGAPVIEPDWAGFVDIRRNPQSIGQISEAVAFPPLARLLLRLNSAQSPVQTSKCDLWEPHPGSLGCYVDLLPREKSVFSSLEAAEMFCRGLVAKLDCWMRPANMQTWNEDRQIRLNCPQHTDVYQKTEVELVIRQAVSAIAEGFGVTAYISAQRTSQSGAEELLAAGMDVFADALLNTVLPLERIQS